MHEISQHFPFNVEPLPRSGFVRLSFEIEAINLPPFVQMLDSLTTFFRIVNNKAKNSIAIQKVPEMLAAGELNYQRYCEYVNDTFKQLRIEAQEQLMELNKENAKLLLSRTNVLVKQLFVNSSYDQVKQILIKSGELRKSGYFSKKY